MAMEILTDGSFGAEDHQNEFGRCLGRRQMSRMLRLLGRWLFLGLAA